MNTKRNISIAITVLVALAITAGVLVGVLCFRPQESESGFTGRGVYGGMMIAHAEGSQTSEIGATKRMTSVKKDFVLFATEIRLDPAAYSEIGYKVSKNGGTAVAHSSDTYYTGINVKTAEGTRNYKLKDIFGEESDAIGMIVNEFDYREVNAYTFTPYVKANDMTESAGTAIGLAAAGNAYELELTNCTVTDYAAAPETVAGSGSTVYKTTAGNALVITADTAPAGKMLVGWEKDGVRTGEMSDSLAFAMPGENMTYSPVYNTISSNDLLPAESFTMSGVTKEAIAGTEDTDYEGFKGLKLTIPADKTAGSSLFTKNRINTQETNDFREKVVKFILKNRGDYDIKLNISGEYFGNMTSSGNFVAKAGDVTSVYMTVPPAMRSSTEWRISIVENMAGNSGETVELDIVAATAFLYPDGSDVIAGGSSGDFVHFGNTYRKIDYNNLDWKVESTDSSTIGSSATDASHGVVAWWTKGALLNYRSASVSSLVTKASLPAGDTVTLYVKLTNLVSVEEFAPNDFEFVVRSKELNLCTYLDDASKPFHVIQPVSFTAAGQSAVYKFTINKADITGDLYMGARKASGEFNTNHTFNVLMQYAYSDIFDTEEFDNRECEISVQNATVTDLAGNVLTADGNGKYHYFENDPIVVKPNAAPAGSMLVGWDKDGVRTSKMADKLQVFLYGDAGTYAPAYNTCSTGAIGNFSDKSSGNKMTSSAITGTDAEYSSFSEGFSGLSLTVPADHAAGSATFTNDLIDTQSSGHRREKVVKFILRNTGAYDVKLNIYGEYFGNYATTGDFVARANSVTSAYALILPYLKYNTTWTFKITEAIGGASGDSFELDFVAGVASKYATGSDIIATEAASTDFVALGNTYTRLTSSNDNTWGSGMGEAQKDAAGKVAWWTKGKAIKSAGLYATSQITETEINRAKAIYSGQEKISVYVKLTNLVGVPDYINNSFEFVIRNFELNLWAAATHASRDPRFIAIHEVNFTKAGESVVFKFDISPDEIILTNSTTQLYLGMRKKQNSSISDSYTFNVLMQYAYSNVFGVTEFDNEGNFTGDYAWNNGGTWTE